MTTTTLICDCNKTMPLDGPALIKALGPEATGSAKGLDCVHSLLCRREAGAFQRAAKSGDDLLVACTQESQLFLQLNEQTEGALPLSERPIRFFNIRETAGWSADARRQPAAVLPKIAALIAQAQLPDPAPVSTVSYRSEGRLLIIGDATRAHKAAQMVADKLDVSILLTHGGGALPQQRSLPVHVGELLAVQGWLGEFDVKWRPSGAIDMDLCTRCNACISACPEGAIDFGYQIDLQVCKSHRDCVAACGVAGAIDFERVAEPIDAKFDLILDLRERPAFAQHQPPQGYFHVGSSEPRLFEALLQLADLRGEFEKPKFFNYQQKLCAHSRNEQIGCQACIDVCSTRAIRSDASLKGKTKRGGAASLPGIIVEPHLCVGCGACTTVCPSGALSYATPTLPQQGLVIRTLLASYMRAGGLAPALLLHSQNAGAALLADLGRAAQAGGQGSDVQGLPARVLPLALWHSASVGLELFLTALAQGASQLMILLTEEDAPEYREALAAQAELANALMAGLGFAGGPHVLLLQARDARDLPALDAALRVTPAQTVAVAATFNPQAEKRATLELALSHLLQHAPLGAGLPEQIALPQGPAFSASPFGSISVDADRCSMCLSCVSACPAAALADNPDKLQLRFIEKNCVQCGLCASTCPEQAISLQPRLLLADGGRLRKQMRVLNEVEPFCCVRCAKPFASPKAIELMLAKLGAHPMFQGEARERLQMCGDCRVIAMHSNPNEVKIDQL